MASNFLPKLMTHLSLISQVVFLLILPLIVFSTQAEPFEKYVYEREIVKRYYILEIMSGPNATKKFVAGIAGKPWSPTTFGSIAVAEHLLLEDPSLYSQKIGKVRGLLVVASKDGRNSYISSSIMFTSPQYNYSTLEVQGTFNRASTKPSALSIVGGTEKWKGARGIATLRTYLSTKYYTITQVEYKFSLIPN